MEKWGWCSQAQTSTCSEKTRSLRVTHAAKYPLHYRSAGTSKMRSTAILWGLGGELSVQLFGSASEVDQTASIVHVARS